MLTANLYGNASVYFTGTYPSAAGNLVPPARFLSGLTVGGAAYNGSNLGVRRVNYYSGANQSVTDRLTTAGVVFVGRWGVSRAAFPLNEDWSTNKTVT